jgi:hypothetical protein
MPGLSQTHQYYRTTADWRHVSADIETAAQHEGLQCIPPALVLAEGHAKSQVRLHTSFTCCDPCGFIW